MIHVRRCLDTHSCSCGSSANMVWSHTLMHDSSLLLCKKTVTRTVCFYWCNIQHEQAKAAAWTICSHLHYCKHIKQHRLRWSTSVLETHFKLTVIDPASELLSRSNPYPIPTLSNMIHENSHWHWAVILRQLTQMLHKHNSPHWQTGQNHISLFFPADSTSHSEVHIKLKTLDH